MPKTDYTINLKIIMQMSQGHNMSKEWDNFHDMRILGRIVEVHSTE